MKKLFLFIILVLQNSSMAVKWEAKTIEDLNTAISWNNTYAIQKIIEFHPDFLNQEYKILWNDYTPLIKAVKSRNFAAAQRLLALGADPNVTVGNGKSPLFEAIVTHESRKSKDNETCYIELLAEHGADLNAVCSRINNQLQTMPNDGISLLKLAASYNIEKLKNMVEHGADIEQVGVDGETVAIFSLRYCSIETAHYLIVEKKANVTRPYYYYSTPSSRLVNYSEKHYAVELLSNMVFRPGSKEYKMAMEIIEEFKRQGVECSPWLDKIIERSQNHQPCPVIAKWENKTIEDLYVAISKNNSNAIKRIIEHHPEYLNYIGSVSYDNPLIRAIAYRHYAAAKQLLVLGADPNVHSRSTYTPMMAAIQNHPNKDIREDTETKYIKLLAEYGAIINDTCHYIPGELAANQTTTSMLQIAERENDKKLRCLVELGANIEQTGVDSVTVAIQALMLNDMKAAHYLIVEKHADITHPFYKFKSPASQEIDYSTKHYAVEFLLSMVFRLDSEDYKLKMEIVDEFKRQGVDYQSWKDRISQRTIKQIKALYKDEWEEYVLRY